MKREEAEKYIGELVVTCCVKGTWYYGELIEIVPVKPFRAKVKVCGVNTYPRLYAHNTNGAFFDFEICRSANLINNEGIIVETGNRIELYTGEQMSYKDSLIKAIKSYLEETKRNLDEFNKDSRYWTCWINNKSDCVKLHEILTNRLSELNNAE